ncbi:hypothetical protein BZA70DRAFT_284123 [Myxozyma melibiosi]|uniref:Uncharacterized protein n=1 Tax=Myxozyma melibiosi TaxID=54550 RepID=A0ABR1F040_9ASCO
MPSYLQSGAALLTVFISLSSAAVYFAFKSAEEWSNYVDTYTDYNEGSDTSLKDLTVLSITGGYKQRVQAQNVLIARAIDTPDFTVTLATLLRSSKRLNRLRAVRTLALILSKTSDLFNVIGDTCKYEILTGLEVTLLYTIPDFNKNTSEDVDLRSETMAVLNQYIHFFRNMVFGIQLKPPLLTRYFKKYIALSEQQPSKLAPLELVSDTDLYEHADEQMYTLMRRLLDYPAFKEQIRTYKPFKQAWSGVHHR